MSELITQSAYAARRGVTIKTVQEAIAKGQITAKKEKRKVLIDPEVADKEWEANRRGKGDTANNEYSKARTIREKANAERAVLELAEYKNTLIKKDDAIAVVEGVAFQVKEKMRSMPQKLSATLAAHNDPREVELILQKEIDDALFSLAEMDL